MRLKIKSQSSLIMPLMIDTAAGSCTVHVHRLTRRQSEELGAATSQATINRVTGLPETQIDAARWNQLAPDAYIDRIDGLTPGIVRCLGIDLDEEPSTDGDGCLDGADRELLRQLWIEAHADKFALPIMRFSREMLAAEHAQKKSASLSSVGTSERERLS